MKLIFNFTIDTTTGQFEITNTETGEVKEGKFNKTSKAKVVKKTKDDNSNPQIILEDNKYKLNNASVELLNIIPGDKLEINYEQYEGNLTPIIGKAELFGNNGGNKVTKSFTVSCRGKANEQLSKYGNAFQLKEKQEGVFFLIGDKQPEKVEASDDIELPSDEPDIDLSDDDLELSDLIDDNDLTAQDFNF